MYHKIGRVSISRPLIIGQVKNEEEKVREKNKIVQTPKRDPEELGNTSISTFTTSLRPHFLVVGWISRWTDEVSWSDFITRSNWTLVSERKVVF